jgi:hypothetical protein
MDVEPSPSFAKASAFAEAMADKTDGRPQRHEAKTFEIFLS